MKEEEEIVEGPHSSIALIQPVAILQSNSASSHNNTAAEKMQE